jgi:HSP20 family protein
MTSIVRLDCFRDLMGFRNAMDTLMDETVGRPGSPFAALGSPAIDLYQTADVVIVRAAVPGVIAKDLNISITGDVLSLRGGAQAEGDAEEAHFHIKERRCGRFTRSIGLPTSVVDEKADA